MTAFQLNISKIEQRNQLETLEFTTTGLTSVLLQIHQNMSQFYAQITILAVFCLCKHHGNMSSNMLDSTVCTADLMTLMTSYLKFRKSNVQV